MPGCNESFVDFLAAAETEGVETIVSLSTPGEIEAGSPDYARAIEEEDTRLTPMITVAGRVFPHSEEETGAFYRAALMGKLNVPLDQAHTLFEHRFGEYVQIWMD
jgi:hypothetical protein